MAPRISSLYCLIIIASLIDYRAGGSPKLSLGFTVLSPPEVIALRNHPLLLNCSGYSEEGPLQTSWRFQDADIKDKHLMTFSNGSLRIERVVSQKKRERRWDGNYTCVLRNNVGLLVSRPIHVVLARMSKSFTYEPQSLTTHEGGQARLNCQINAVPPATISWYKDGTELPQNDSRFVTLPSGTLQITGVTTSDTGGYKCRGSNIARQKNSSEAILTVEPRTDHFKPPVFFDTSEEVIAVVGEPAVLECFANGFPKVDIFWRREDGKEITEHFLGNSNLFFPKVQRIHSGSYVCVAKVTNKETGQILEATHKVSLRVYVPPTFTKVPVSQMIPTSQTVRFDCEVDSIPASSITWVKDGEQLYINGRIKLKPGNTLVVSHTVTSDSGIYQCVASNPAGVNTSAARLQVNVSSDQPHPPPGLKAVTMSSSAILLSWEAVYSPASSPIQAYTVHYVPTNGGQEQNAVAVNTSHLIERLKPYTNYTFYVRAYNNKSASEPSKPIVQMTGEDVPLVAPIVTLSSKSATTLHVQWSELPADKTRGVIVEHRLFYRKYMQASNTVQTLKSGYEYTITGLIPKQKYEVRVLSGTKAGFPKFSDEAWPWVVYEMPDVLTTKVPSSPILHLTVINSTALEVEWSMPNDNPYPVLGFYLSYRQQHLPLKHHVSLPSNATKYQLFDLVPQSWYEVHLVAFNINGESQEAVRNIITFSGDNPDAETVEVVEPPHQLEAEPTSSTSIHLTWKTPITNRNISYYTVRYHPVFTSGLVNESYIYYIRSTNNEVLITDLQPFTLYEFSVRSHDAHKRQGPFSQVVECRTIEDLPSAPEDLSWSPVDAYSVRLNWQPPKQPNGIITGYRIMYSNRIDDDNLDLWNSKEEKGTESTAILSGLSSNTHYYLCMKARNAAGLSPPTPIISLNIPVRHNNSRPPSHETFDAEPPDPFLGIVLGISIGVGCIIICAVIILCRIKCCATQPDPGSEARYSVCCGNGYVPHLNGHIIGNLPSEKRASNVENQEMECFTPMLNNFSNGSSNEHHLDTKGGYPTNLCNGKVNGFPHQYLVNSRSSLGSHQGSTASAHLSDSEDRPAAKQRIRYTTNDCRISENSWQDETADITSSTVLLDSENLSLSLQASDSVPPSQLENKPPPSPPPPPSASGAKNNNNTETESSCITESKRKSRVKSSSPEETLTTCTVPPVSPASQQQHSHRLPSDIGSSSDRNSVPSGDERKVPPRCTKDNDDDDESDCGDESQSLPFSVNAFLSPLAGPRFSQSTTTSTVPDSDLEPT